MELLVILALIVALLSIWVVSTRQKLVVMDEDINNVMSQIGVQLSIRFDTLITLVNIAKECALEDIQVLENKIKENQKMITAQSCPGDVKEQEEIISGTVIRLSSILRKYPDCRESEKYTRGMDALNYYEKMLQTSKLIYNDNVSKFNKTIRLLPVSIIAGMLGFHQKDFLK